MVFKCSRRATRRVPVSWPRFVELGWLQESQSLLSNLLAFDCMAPMALDVRQANAVSVDDGQRTRRWTMSKSSGSKGGQAGGRQPTGSSSKAGSPGRERPANGFIGGNWPSTTGAKSGGNRGNTTPSAGKK